MVHAIFCTHQTSGVCAGICMCDCTHQTQKTAVDYYSDYFEIDWLYCTTTSTVIKNVKNPFMRHGIPDKVMTDNRPNLVSDKFVKFTESWNFLNTTSSPYYSYSNGKAEAAVKIAKTLLWKVKHSKLNFYKTLLDWWNTSAEGVNDHCHNKFFCNVYKQNFQQLNNCSKCFKTRVWINYEKETVKYHNKKLKNLPLLEEGQPIYVWYQPVKKGTPWDPGRVKNIVNNWSYIVSTDGYDARRNHIDIWEQTCSNGEMMTNSKQNMSIFSDPINSENQSIWRSSRTIKWKRLNEQC